MINKFKELLGKVVSKQEVETQTTMLQKKAGTYEVECAIDEEVVDCNEMDNPPFVGVPAPAYLEDDPWFGPAPVRTRKADGLYGTGSRNQDGRRAATFRTDLRISRYPC